MSANHFADLSLFQDLTPEDRELVYPLFRVCRESAGNVIFEQGDPAIHLYVVIDGDVSILYKPDDGPEITISHVRSEGVVGWSSAIGSPVYTSTAVCSTECRLLCLSGDSLRKLYQEHPETGALILGRLAALIAERLKNTHQYVMALLEQGLRIKIDNTVVTS
jgi:CRP-like cAMP-binding protein